MKVWTASGPAVRLKKVDQIGTERPANILGDIGAIEIPWPCLYPGKNTKEAVRNYKKIAWGYDLIYIFYRNLFHNLYDS